MIGRRAEQERSVFRITVKVQCFLLVGMICASMAASFASHHALCSIAQAAEPAAEIKVAYVETPWKAGVSLFQEAVTGTEIQSTYLTYERIQQGELTTDEYDILYVPGGGVASQLYGKKGELGGIGQRKAREFVASGGGYFGICGGAYAGSHGPHDYCIGLANVKIVSTATGGGDIEIRMEKGASEIFASPEYLPSTVRNIRHANGPLWQIHDGNKPLYAAAAFTGRTGTKDFRPDHPCAQPGSFFAGHPCIVYDFYGKGRVVLCSSHPELADKATGNAAMIPQIIRWLAGRTPRPKKRLLKVEKISQLPSYCGPAAMEMVLRYWGYPEHTQQRIATAVEEAFPSWKIGPVKKGGHGRGILADQVLWYFQNKAPKGLAIRTGLYEPDDDAPLMPQLKTPQRQAARRALLAEVKSHIAKGRPVLILGYTYRPPEKFPVERKQLGKHWRVAAGYDETAQPPTITVLHTSTSTSEEVWPEELFMKYWDVTNPRYTPAQGWNLFMLVYDPRPGSIADEDCSIAH